MQNWIILNKDLSNNIMAWSLAGMALRLLVAFGAGFLIGWERETHGRPAGLRTNILACVASALAMVISEVLFTQSAISIGSGSWHPDPARLGAGILTGIGFLGAGTILRHANLVRGITTAATLWFVTVLGLTFGSGQFLLGLTGLALALVTLHILPKLEKFIDSDWYATMSLRIKLEGLDEQELRERIQALGAVLQAMRLTYDVEKQQKTFICELKLRRRKVFEISTRAVAELTKCPGVLGVRWF